MGNILSTHSEIENCFTSFYKILWSSNSSHSIDTYFAAMSDDLVVLNEGDKELLIKPFSKREVYQTLKSMPCNKSPGLDGMNIEFYLFYWKLVGDHFFNGIHHFYDTALIPRSYRQTFVALIPKKKTLFWLPISI